MMAVTLAALVARLQAQVPAKNSIPAAADYSQHVQDGVLQLSQDAPMRKIATLPIVSGTADYALPADFLFLIDFPVLGTEDGVMVNASGIIPLPSSWWAEEITISGDTLTITPTPTYTLERSYRYAARHVLTGSTGSETYAALNENAARVALLYAQYLALSQQVVSVAGSAWKYSIGDESVDKSQQASGYKTAAEVALAGYRRAIAPFKGFGL